MNYNVYEKLKKIEKHIEKTSNKKWMSIKEASNYSGLSVSTLRRAIDDGRLKASRSTGKLLFKPSEIERWLND